MAKLVSRVVLGISAVCAIAGGGALVVMAIVYFQWDRYVPQFQLGTNGLLVGLIGLGLYVAGSIPVHIAGRIAAGLGIAVGSYVGTVAIASLVSLLADPGGRRGNLEDGTTGLIWLVLGGYLAWEAVTGNWPVTRDE